MSLPSLTQLRDQVFAAFKRFPLAIISAITATIVFIYLVESIDQENLFYISKIAAVAILGISLFTTIPLITEKKEWSNTINTATHILGVALLAGYYFLLPATEEAILGYMHYRYLLYFIGVHLLVAVAPFWGEGQPLSFWQYNKTLFLRILTAILFSGVLFVGLAAALGSVQFLFQIEISMNLYLELFIIIGGIFNTWFFLAGIPAPIQQLDDESTYPKGLKIFTRNVLLPLIVIYLIILYLYAGKIIIQWSWPEGWVSILILIFSTVGILANLLLYPLQNKTGQQWIKRFSKSYYLVLSPLVILLILAIWRRIHEYGFTIERYFVFVLGFWLLGLVAYFILSKKENIKVIPTSLCILVFVISLGPWGVFSVSQWSQVNRLQSLLKQNSILKEGVIHKAVEPLPEHDAMQISSILRYLDQAHGLKSVQLWLQNNLAQITSKKEDNYDTPKEIAALLGVKYYRYYHEPAISDEELTKRTSFETNFKKVIDTRQLDWLMRDSIYWTRMDSTSYPLGDKLLVIKENETNPHIQIYFKNEKQEAISINLKNIILQLNKTVEKGQNRVPPETMVFSFSNESMQVNLYFSLIRWRWKQDSIDVEWANFFIGIDEY